MHRHTAESQGAHAPKSPLRGWLSRQVHALSVLGDTPHRTAFAFALGVFLSFSPFLGLQIAIGFTAAFALRLHRLAVLAGLCANLPMIMVPYYALTTAAGAAILGVGLAQDIRERFSAVLAVPFYTAAFWTNAVDLLWPFYGAFVVGSLLGAALLGVGAYFALAPVLARIAPRPGPAHPAPAEPPRITD